MSDRQRQRRGHHASVAGSPAEEVLGDLVAQFADPYAFVRELVQNSLDAGAVAIDLDLSWDDGLLRIDLVDDGEGMDRATIEGYLLTLFRSTKEDDLTKIGKFGIGFVSLFAMNPNEVVVDTGRDGIWHRVTFDRERAYELREMADPFEGTTVSLRVPCRRKDAWKIAKAVLASAHRWCRFAEADIRTRVRVPGNTDTWEPLQAAFEVDAPVSVSVHEDAFEAVIGTDSNTPARVTFLGHGLVLWDGEADLVPGVCFLVKSRLLEHTLTRDDVRRDARFHQIVQRVRTAATGPLRDAVEDALSEAASARDLPRMREVCASLRADLPFDWRTDRPLLPAVGRDPVALRELGSWGDWLKRLVGVEHAPLVVGRTAEPLAEALAAEGQIVLEGVPSDPHIQWALAWLGWRPVLRAAAHYIGPVAAEPTPEVTALLDATARSAAALGHRVQVHAAHFAGRGDSLRGALAICQRTPFSLEEVTGGVLQLTEHLLVDVEHALVTELARVPLPMAGLMLAQAALSEAGGASVPVPAEVAADVVGAR
jgi:molecular chaperone HtpG